MTTTHHQPQRHRRWRLGALLHRWHRRVGLCAAAFLIWLAISGLLLNESGPLGLEQTRIAWPWLMQLYGLQTGSLSGLRAGDHWLVTHDDQTLLDSKPLAMPIAAPIGIVQAGELLYVATRDSIVLLRAADGLRIDELRAPPLPATPILRIGSKDAQLVIDTGTRYQSADGETWSVASTIADGEVQWSSARTLPESELQRAGLRPSLPLSRVLADLHSGQLFGRSGKTVIDLAGFAALLLAITGLWSLARRRRSHHGHP